MVEQAPVTKFKDLDLQKKVDFIMKDRTPSPEQVIFEPTIEFLDRENLLTREERAKVVAMGDRTAISYGELAKKVVSDRGRPEKTSNFFLQYALSARDSKEISHTSILEQSGVGPVEFGGDKPIIMEGISILSGLRDICTQRHGSFEALSSRGAIFPDGYWRIPNELKEAGIGSELSAINKELYRVYIDLTKVGIEYYLKSETQKPGEDEWRYRWRILNLALDDSRQVTNGSWLNHLSYHPNSALAIRETISELSSSPLPETRAIAASLRELASQGLPTLMRHTEASPYTANLPQVREQLVEKLRIPRTGNRRGVEGKSRLISAVTTVDPDLWVLSAFVASSKNVDFAVAFNHLKNLPTEEIKLAIDEVFKDIGLHDKPPKELEMIRITEIYELSLGAIYEAFRHRLQTNIANEFGINRGYTTPQIYKEMNVEDAYLYGIKLNEKAHDLIDNLGANYSVFAPYFVSRAHLQAVTIRMSGLDAFHFIKVRSGNSAHPDIRGPAQELEKYLRAEKGILFDYLIKK